uniref:DnaJ C terminal domain protein n=1 Tax=Nucleocytoviricota sp. TaxID=2809609 RepID=A0A9E8G4W4_9VIRU|nr:DnaJ C terminal domain protein [Nucleocytoviricota sp.]UZT29094.1 DnaJ C terminal domain protein [Nucleocytoviricota sp.]
MEINKCKELFNLNDNYTYNELQYNYNRLILKYHKDNNNDINFYENLKNNYNILLCNLNNLQNNNISTINNNNIKNLDNYKNQIQPVNNYINKKDIYEKENNYTTEYYYIDPINIELIINFEDAYIGCSKPITIQRIVNNYSVINKEIENYYLKIPKGVDDNEIIIIPKKGNCHNNNYGDIKVIIKLQNHNLFKRNGLDLYFEKNISLKESLLGFSFDLVFLNNKKYKINNDKILLNKQIIIKNLGFIRDDFNGNLIINFNIIFPENLTQIQKERLSEIL